MSGPTARLLLAEDDATLSEVIASLLEQENYEVLRAVDGESALRLAQEEKPDLILLDVLLPKLSGFEVCQRVRQDPETCLIPILLVTALGNTKDKVTGFKLGADEYLSKPFEPLELLARIERMVRRSREELAANPLTGLPGAVSLDREIRRRLTEGEPFTVARADVSGLTAFNRTYGYESGDHVVRLAAMILRSAAQELGNATDFVAHLGGQQFAFVSNPVRAEVVASRALENADALFLLQYNEWDRARFASGGSAAGSRIALFFGLVDVTSFQGVHPVALLDQAADALTDAKKTPNRPLDRRPAMGPSVSSLA